MNAYDATSLDAELRAAGVRIVGCSSAGRVGYAPEADDTDRAAAASVLAAHDPARGRATRDRAALVERLLDREARRAAAERLGLTAEASALAAEVAALRARMR